MALPTECAAIARLEREPLCGTASRVRNWLLVEQSGTWGPNALTDSSLDRRVAQELKARAHRYGVRVLLIRGSQSAGQRARHCFAAHSGLDRPWISHWTIEDPSELLDVDLEPIVSGEPPAQGSPWNRPLYLVCTNGERDPCCAIYGRPVLERLAAAARRDVTWESSHVGGDRFAANIVCLPHGLYFGHVEPDEVEHVARLYEAGDIDLDHFRGRSCYEPVVQAADVILRGRSGLTGIDDLAPQSRRDHGGGESTLEFLDAAGARHRIRLAVGRGEKVRLTCNSTHPGAPRRFIERPLTAPQ